MPLWYGPLQIDIRVPEPCEPGVILVCIILPVLCTAEFYDKGSEGLR